MQCTNQDQYRTIYTMSVSVCVCECVLAFDILIYLFHAHNGLVGWMACSFRYFHPNPPRMPSNHSNSQFPRRREKKISRKRKGKKSTATASTTKNCTLRNAMLRAIKHYYIHTGRQAEKAGKRMARPIWMNLYALCTQ